MQLGNRAETHLQNFLEHASDWRLIAPMMGASMAYTLGRSTALSRLLSRPEARWFTRGRGAEAAAAGLGFLGENAVFTASVRGVQGRADTSWGQDYLRNGMTLGFLKAGGFAGKAGVLKYSRWRGITPFQPAVALEKTAMGVASHSSGYLALAGAHGLEEKLGWRPSSGALWLDALADYVALTVGGRVGHEFLGPRYQAMTFQLDHRAKLSRPQTSLRRQNDATAESEQTLPQKQRPPVAAYFLPGAPMMLAMSFLTFFSRGRKGIRRLMFRVATGPRTTHEFQNSWPAIDFDPWVQRVRPELVRERLDDLQHRYRHEYRTPDLQTLKAVKDRTDATGLHPAFLIHRLFPTLPPGETEGWLDVLFPPEGEGIAEQAEFIRHTAWIGGTRRLLDYLKMPELDLDSKRAVVRAVGELHLREAIPHLEAILKRPDFRSDLRHLAAFGLAEMGRFQEVRSFLAKQSKIPLQHKSLDQAFREDLLPMYSSPWLWEGRRKLNTWLLDPNFRPEILHALDYNPRLIFSERHGNWENRDPERDEIATTLFQLATKEETDPDQVMRIARILRKVDHPAPLDDILQRWTRFPVADPWIASQAFRLLGREDQAIHFATRALYESGWYRAVQAAHYLDQVQPAWERGAFGLWPPSLAGETAAPIFFPGRILTGDPFTPKGEVLRSHGLTTMRLTRSEQRFGHWKIAEIKKVGGHTHLHLRRLGMGEEDHLPADVWISLDEGGGQFIQEQEVWWIAMVRGAAGRSPEFVQLRSAVRANAEAALTFAPRDQVVNLRFDRETGAIVGKDQTAARVITVQFEFNEAAGRWALTDNMFKAVLSAFKIMRDPAVYQNNRAVLEGALQLATEEQLKGALLALGKKVDKSDTHQEMSARLTMAYDFSDADSEAAPEPVPRRHTPMYGAKPFRAGSRWERSTEEWQALKGLTAPPSVEANILLDTPVEKLQPCFARMPHHRGPAFLAHVPNPGTRPLSDLLKVVLHVGRRLTLVPADTPENGTPKIVIQVELPDHSHDYHRNDLVDLAFEADRIGGGIDLVPNPAADYVQRFRGRKFEESVSRQSFWLMRILTDQQLAMIPGRWAVHDLLGVKALENPSGENPLVKIITAGPSAEPERFKAIYTFQIPYDFGVALGFLGRESRSGPWRLRADTPKKLVVAPEKIPLAHHEVDSDHWHVSNNKEGERPGLATHEAAKVAKQAANVAPSPFADWPLEDRVTYITMDVDGYFGRQPTPFMVVPAAAAGRAGNAFFYPARVARVRERGSGDNYERWVVLEFTDPILRPVEEDRVRVGFSSPEDFPYQAGENIYLVMPVVGAAGEAPAAAAPREVKVPLQTLTGEYYEFTVGSRKGADAMYFPTAPVAKMEWKQRWRVSGLLPGQGRARQDRVLTVHTQSLTGASRTYRFNISPEQASELGIELKPQGVVAWPADAMFHLQSFSEIRMSLANSLRKILKALEGGKSQAVWDLKIVVDRLRQLATVDDADLTWMEQKISGIDFDATKNRLEELEDIVPLRAKRRVAWTGLDERERVVTLILADHADAPQKPETWEVVKQIPGGVILGKKGEGEKLPVGFLRFYGDPLNLQDLEVGRRVKVIPHVMGAAGLRSGQEIYRMATGVEAQLEWTGPGEAQLVLQPRPQHFRIGRGEGNLGQEVLAGEETISREHVRIRRRFQGNYFIENLSHTNPVHIFPLKGEDFPAVDGVEHSLRHGDRFRLGKVTIQLLEAGRAKPVDPRRRTTIKDITLEEREVIEFNEGEKSAMDPGLHFLEKGKLVLIPDPKRILTTLGAFMGHESVLGFDGVVELITDPFIRPTHAQVFRTGPGEYLLRNASRAGLTLQPAEGEPRRMQARGEESPLIDGDRIHLGSQEILFKILPRDEEVPLPTNLQVKSLEAHWDSGSYPALEESKTWEMSPSLPEHVQVFPPGDFRPAILGREEGAESNPQHNWFNLWDPVVARRHVRLDSLPGGQVRLQVLEEHAGSESSGVGGVVGRHDGWGTWVQVGQDWQKLPPEQTAVLDPGDRFALGTVIEGPEFKDALVFRVAADGRSLHREEFGDGGA